MSELNELWQEKIEKFSKIIWSFAEGDDDYYQEGLLGIRTGLLRNPNGTDAFLLNAAKWAILHYRDKGVSIDNGAKWAYTKQLADGTPRTYQKDTTAVYIDSPKARLEFADYKCPPDILALDRVCAERFYSSLSEEEAGLVEVCIQTLNGHFYNLQAMRTLSITWYKYCKIKRAARNKFVKAFGTDEQVEQLYARR